MEFRLKDMEPVIREVLNSDGTFCLYPKGTSMLPLIWEKRDYIRLGKAPEQLKRMDIILYQRENGAYVLHRILKVNKDEYILCGDNQLALEYGIKREQVIGVVTAIGRKGKERSIKAPEFRIYEMIWGNLFIRKIYFFVFKHRYIRWL